jgi:hypothetical protein
MSPEERGRFRVVPIPRYSSTTSSGTRVSCAGCCLPLPLGCLTTVVAVAAPLTWSVLRRTRTRT